MSSLAAGAFLVLWNDFPAEYDAEYNRWHSIEHVPERVAVAGFRSGRRYVALEPGQQPQGDVERYLTWYELDALSVIDSADYRRLLDHPTPWSASMRPRFRNLQRAACDLAWTSGEGIGAFACVARWSAATDRDAVDDKALHSLRALPGITGVHKGVAEAAGQALPWATPAAARRDRAPITSVLMVESYALETLRDAVSTLQRSFGTAQASVALGLYSLVYLCVHR